MHMKRLLIVSDDVHTRAWAAQALGSLDLSSAESPLGEMQKRLMDGEFDLVVVDGGRSPEVLAQVVEHAASGGLDLKLLVVLESEALTGLRLPVRVPSDFFVRGGSADELAARVRTLLWPGEEVIKQELVRVDNLTLNLATYQAYLEGDRLHLPRVRALRLPGDPSRSDLLPRSASAPGVGKRLLRWFENRGRTRPSHSIEDRRRALSAPRNRAQRRLSLERLADDGFSALAGESCQSSGDPKVPTNR